MADKKECINWFLEEIPILTEKGIIQAETATALTEHYRSDLAAQPPKREILPLRRFMTETHIDFSLEISGS